MIVPTDIAEAVRALGVGPQDTLLVHASMAGAIRAAGADRQEKMDTVVEGLAACVPAGTLMMPTFTYSFARDEAFDARSSPSTVGALTEHFRTRPGVRRTTDPMFSVAVRGPTDPAWEERLFAVSDHDCFGPDSVFAYLEAVDARMLFFGVGFEYCTYLYLVEQRERVPYRYVKRFTGRATDGTTSRDVHADYYVRDLEAGVENDFIPLGEELLERGDARRAKMDRGPSLYLVGAQAVTAHATARLREDANVLLAGARG